MEEGVVSWADHIQATHSQRLILRSTKVLMQPEKTSKELHWEHWEPYGNLQNPTQMLS